MNQNSIGQSWQDPFTENEIGNGNTAQQASLITESNRLKNILSALCDVSQDEIVVFEILRNKQNEINDYNFYNLSNPDKQLLETENLALINSVTPDTIKEFAASGLQLREYECSHRDKFGKKIWYLIKLLVIKKTERGETEQILAIIKDITKIKSLELISLKKQRLNRAIDASPDILFILNLHDLAILYANEEVKEIFHYSPSQIVKLGGSFMKSHIHPDDKEKTLKYFSLVASSNKYPLRELHYRMKDALGDWHNIRCKHSIFQKDNNGYPLQIIGVKQDITEHKKVRGKSLHAKIEFQQDISSAILEAQEGERKRIAEALHNSLGQVLYGVRMNLNMLVPDKSDPSGQNEQLKAKIVDLLDEAISETKTISFELMPATLEDFGLETAIRHILRNKLDKSVIKYSARISGLKQRLKPETEIAIFRIIQELINNVIKHSKASRTEVTVNKSDHSINIKITDNGVGFNVSTACEGGNGFGLRSIISRVEFLNGYVNFGAAPKGGSTIIIEIPS